MSNETQATESRAEQLEHENRRLRRVVEELSGPGGDRVGGLERFLDLSPDLICVAGFDGFLKRVGRSLERLLGHGRDELLSRPFFEFIHPADRDPSALALGTLASGSELVDFQNRFRRADGTYRALEWRARAELESGLVYAIARDVTERQRLDVLMAQTHAVARVGGWELDLHTNELFWTTETYGLHETSPDEYRPEVATAIGFYAPESRPIIQAAVERAIAEGTPFDLELDLVTARGRRLRVRAVGEAQSVDGETQRVFGSFQDVTERYRMERERERFFRLVQASPDFIGMADTEQRVRFINRSGRRMLGLPLEGELDVTLSDLHRDEAGTLVRDTVLPAIDEHGSWAGETEVRRADGTELPVLLQAFPSHDEAGEVEFYCASMIDLSERRELESQLRQAQKLEGIGRLAGGIAHDFNNLLTVILGSAELMSEAVGDDPLVRDSLRLVQSSGERASALTQQLLTFARRQVTEPRVLDVNELLAGEALLLESLVGQGVQLEIAAAPELWPVEIDPVQLQQVLINLAVNARDAMPSGGRLRIETANLELADGERPPIPGLEPGAYVSLCVTDTGHGIPPEHLPAIFEPFYTTKERGRGTGLGLATCHGIVHKAGGEIRAESEPGQGTTLRVCLPRSEERAASLSKAAAPSSLSGGETLLLVEDEDGVRAMTAQALEQLGYRVCAAADVGQALAIWRAEGDAVDLLLSDIVLPDGNGLELADRLTAERPDLPTLFVSGYPVDADGSEAVLGRETNFLQKPYTSSELASALRGVLDDAGAPAERGSPARPSDEAESL